PLLRRYRRSGRANVYGLTTGLRLPALDLWRNFLSEEAHALLYVVVRNAVIAERAIDVEIADHLTAMAQRRQDHVGRAPQVRSDEFLNDGVVAESVDLLGRFGVVLVRCASCGEVGAVVHSVMLH